MLVRVWARIIDSVARRIAAQMAIQQKMLERDLYHQLQRRATRESVDYIAANMGDAVYFADRAGLIAHAFGFVPAEGSVLQFGVYRGKSLGQIAGLTQRTVHGFDSFEGLPESGGKWHRGQFDIGGAPPDVGRNVELHVGWFDETLPRYRAADNSPVAFMHVDCDIYSSTKTIFDMLGDRIVPGTVILFDEYINYPDWQAGEYRAFQEFVSARAVSYKYLSFGAKFRTCVQIEKIGAPADG